MKNTILQQVNDIGSELGYPFYMYPDGTCGKSIVSGKMNAVGIVKKEFPVKELKSDFLSCSDENDKDVLAHLSQIGEKLGFPFYVYADGTCGTKSTSQTDNLPFLMFVKKKFLVEKLVLDPELLQTIQKKKAEEISHQSVSNQSSSMTSYEPMGELSPSELYSQMKTWNDDILKAYFEKYILYCNAELSMIDERNEDVIKAYIEKHGFCYAAEERMLKKNNDNIIKTYIEKRKLYKKVHPLMIEKCNDDIIKAYIEKYKLCDEAESLMIQKRSDDIVKMYIEKYDLCNEAEYLMIQKRSDDIVKMYIGEYDLCEQAECLMLQKHSDNIIKMYIEKYKLCERAQKLMLKRCSDDVIKSYRQKYSISVSMWLLLYKKYGFSNVMRD